MKRTLLTIGEESLTKLSESHILICGLGGVGAYVTEMLVRSGVGEITIVDSDSVDPSNINRQLIALHSTIGERKTVLVSERMRDINPDLKINIIDSFINEDNVGDLFTKCRYDYVVDAIDTLTPKVTFIKECLNHKTPLVSSMGAGAKFDPTKIEVKDISKSNTCPLAYVVRKRLKKHKIYKGFKTVFSTENYDSGSVVDGEHNNFKRSTVGTISYMPAVFGCITSSVVIRDLVGK